MGIRREWLYQSFLLLWMKQKEKVAIRFNLSKLCLGLLNHGPAHVDVESADATGRFAAFRIRTNPSHQHRKWRTVQWLMNLFSTADCNVSIEMKAPFRLIRSKKADRVRRTFLLAVRVLDARYVHGRLMLSIDTSSGETSGFPQPNNWIAE